MRLVLDTNVVLDWLLFELPSFEPLRVALREGQIMVIAHSLLLAELERVLTFPQLQRYIRDADQILEHYRQRTADTDFDPALIADFTGMPANFPRCRDPDDNKFLSLAYCANADALVTKDKALLQLKRRSSALGFRILTVPEMLEALQ